MNFTAAKCDENVTGVGDAREVVFIHYRRAHENLGVLHEDKW